MDIQNRNLSEVDTMKRLSYKYKDIDRTYTIEGDACLLTVKRNGQLIGYTSYSDIARMIEKKNNVGVIEWKNMKKGLFLKLTLFGRGI